MIEERPGLLQRVLGTFETENEITVDNSVFLLVGFIFVLTIAVIFFRKKIN